MPKFKDLLPKNIFGNNSGTKDISTKTSAHSNGEQTTVGHLETDALPMNDPPQANDQCASVGNTPTASAELTESVVRELSDPNYNSLEVVPSSVSSLAAMGDTGSGGAGALAVGSGANALASGPTMNTMNVHNAQQQLVMQFSNINKLHFGSVYNINSNISATANSSRKSSSTDEPLSGSLTTTTDSGKRQPPRKTTSIVAMMQSLAEPSHRMLDTVATHLGEGWKAVMRALGHSEGQIEQALIDHQMHGGIKEVIYQLLLQWLRNAEDGVATLGRLTTLLWESNYREVVQRMKLVWKAETDRRNANTSSKQ